MRGDLPESFRARLTAVLQSPDFGDLPEADRKFLSTTMAPTLKSVPQTDSAYNRIRDLVSTLHIDLTKL